MNKTTILILLLCLTSIVLYGQTTRLQKKALEWETKYEYHLAIDLYQKDYDKTKSNYSLQGLAFCYKRIKDYTRAEELFTQILYSDEATLETYLDVAEMQVANGKYDEAKETLRQFANKTKMTPYAQLLQKSCDSALLWRRQRSPYRIANERQLNSCYSEWGAVMDSKNLYFISDRIDDQPDCSEDATSLKLGTYSGVFVTDYKDDQWDFPFFADNPINAEHIHTGPICFTKNDSLIYVTRTSKKALTQKSNLGREKVNYRTANLEIFSIQNYGMQKVTPFQYNKPQEYSVAYPTLNKKGDVLYFSSDKDGGYGGFDLWYCKLQADGKWSEPINLGKTVNTTGDEVFPFLAENGTLYFSSDGHIGMGGLDIFKTSGKENKWSKPVNLKSPINSHADDFAFCFLSGDTRGFFSSNRKGGQGGDDIYSFAEPKPLIPRDSLPITPPSQDSIKPSQDSTIIANLDSTTNIIPNVENTGDTTTNEQEKRTGKDLFWIVGLTVDRTVQKTLPKIKVSIRNNTLNTVETRFSNADGTFVFEVPIGYVYTLHASSSNYIFVSQNEVDSKGKKQHSVWGEKLELEPLELNKEYRLDKIGGLTYDFDKWEVTPVLEKELEKLIDFLQDNPTYVIEIGSHTDTRGNDVYNRNLSELRAKAVVEYLLDMGIEQSRLKWVGYGAHRLLVPNAQTEEEHRMNRRTTFTILSTE